MVQTLTWGCLFNLSPKEGEKFCNKLTNVGTMAVVLALVTLFLIICLRVGLNLLKFFCLTLLLQFSQVLASLNLAEESMVPKLSAESTWDIEM